MSKSKTAYGCTECGFQSTKWVGRCPQCSEWNTFVEETISSGTTKGGALKLSDFKNTLRSNVKSERIQLLYSEDRAKDAPAHARIDTGISELNRVLGGGLTRDSFVLLGGDPGIGKSTLLLELARGLALTEPEVKILYVSGEESFEQIRGRADRMGLPKQSAMYLASETELEAVFSLVETLKPEVLFLDSLQTFSSQSSESAPGSASQLREISARLMTLAKTAKINVWLVGHVTKEGTIAGPKTVEHMVDTVLYFEGEPGQPLRLLRSVKNRFGSTDEVGVFEMNSAGLTPVANPSEIFLSERKESVPGVSVAASLEGTRPLLVELQALVSPSALAMPRRTSVGIEGNRIAILTAILEKQAGVPLSTRDVYFNVSGGLKLSEPACDLACAAALWSSFYDFAFPTGTLFLGELALTGEVRRIPQIEARLIEAQKLGFSLAVIPYGALKKSDLRLERLKVRELKTIRELQSLFPTRER